MNKELFVRDFSEEVSLGREEIRSLIVQLDMQREELIAALVRNLFANYTGKNILVTYARKDEPERQVCVLCRGTKFHSYSPTSEYVHPIEYTFGDIMEDLNKDVGKLDSIKEIKVISNKEATEFIREMYMKRAQESREYLSKLLDLEE